MFCWLNQKGKIHNPVGPVRPELPPIVHFDRPQTYMFAIDETGTRHAWGLLEEKDFVVPLTDRLQEANCVAGRNMQGYGILTKEGRFLKVVRGQENVVAESGVRTIFDAGLGQLQNGELITLGGAEERLVESFNAEPTFTVEKMISFGGTAAISGGEGTRWQLWEQTVRGGTWERSQALEEALAHAVDIYIAEDRQIHALIPADLIPKSGVWKVADLHRHNATLPASATPPPFPTPGTSAPQSAPTRPAPVVPTQPMTTDAATTALAPIPPPTPLPTVPCRLISIKIANRPLLENDVVSSVERDDLNDLVRLADSMGDNRIAAIRANGQPVAWAGGDPAFIGKSSRPALSVAANLFGKSPLIWQDDAGDLYDHKGKMSIEGRANYFRLAWNLLFVVGEDGTRRFFGTEQDHPHFQLAFPEPPIVHDFVAGNLKHVDVLYRDGRVVRVEDRVVKPFGNKRATRLFSHNLAWSETGGFYPRVVRYPDLDRIFRAPPEQISIRAGMAVVRSEGQYSLFTQKPEGWTHASMWDVALAGVEDVYLQTGRFIHALIPADKVPRSGLWTLDELVAHRRKNP